MKFLSLLLLLFLGLNSSAHTVTITILEGWEETPLENCTVILKSNVGRVLEEVKTDSTGKVIFEDLTYGIHTVEANYNGQNFNEKSRTFKLIKDTKIMLILSPTKQYVRTLIHLEDSLRLERKKLDSINGISSLNDSLPNRSDTQMQMIDQHIKKFVRESVHYPEISLELGEQGIVYVELVLESDATITQVRVFRGVSQELDREAKRLIRSIPPFDFIPPGARFSRMKMRYPIIFTLQ